jgi:hypothetical protein
MGRPFDPARATRERLQILEARERARAESRAVAEGVAETVALSRARGSVIVKTEPEGSARTGPYRRQCGLAWLTKKGRLTLRQAQAGERYGAAFRRAGAAPTIGSTLEVQPGGGGDGPGLALLLKMAEGRRQAEAELARYRAQLLGQNDLIAACDLCCGQELTPREAAGGDRDASRLEAVLKVALDILAQTGR